MTERPDQHTPAVLVVEQDGGLAEALHRTAAALTPAPAVAGVTTLRGIERIAQAADVIVAGPSTLTSSGLARLAALHLQLPTTSFVLAVSGRPGGTLRQLVQVGADDIVAADADAHEFALVLERSLDIARKRREKGVEAAAVPFPAPLAAGGQIISVVSPTGGGGKTFVAANLAVYLARRGKRVILVDLDLQFGEVSTALRLRSDATITNAFGYDEDEVPFEEQLSSCLLSHHEGFSVLAAPRDPAEADFIGAAQVNQVLEALRRQADYVIVDTPPTVGEIVVAALEMSDRLLTLGTADGPSVHNLQLLCGVMRRLGIPRSKISLVLNKLETDVGFDLAATSALFPGGFTAVLPYRSEVSRSLNLGEPIIAATPDADISRGLVQAFEALLSEGERPAAVAPESHKRRRFSLRPGRPVPAAASGIVAPTPSQRPVPAPELTVFPRADRDAAPAPPRQPDVVRRPRPARRPAVGPTTPIRTRPRAARPANRRALRRPVQSWRERAPPPPPGGLSRADRDVMPCGRGASPSPRPKWPGRAIQSRPLLADQ